MSEMQGASYHLIMVRSTLPMLKEAAIATSAKYSYLGLFFKLLIFSVGGLIELEISKIYKGLQSLLGPATASWMHQQVGFIPNRAHMAAAASIGV